MKLIHFAATALAGALFTQAASAAPLLIPGKQHLYQQVLSRPGASLLANAQASTGTEIAGFTPYYVFARQDGKLQVGSDAQGAPTGWVGESQTMPWTHTLIGVFTNPAGRSRAMFLKDAESEQSLLTNANPAEQAKTLLGNALASNPGPVLALEPEDHINFQKQPYFMPILEAKAAQGDGVGPVMIKVASGTMSDSGAKGEATPPAAPKQFKGGLVFVIDTTASMQPYIDQTRAAITQIVHTIGQSEMANDFRFGLVAYRDSLKDSPKLEYATKVYAKPDFSQPLDSILPAISSTHDASVSSSSFDEDAIAGIKTALDEVNWKDLNGKYIVLITDAGARGGSHPNSTTHLDIPEIRQLAEDKGVALFVVHLQTPAAVKSHDDSKARAQYTQLSKFNGTSLYYGVPGGTPEAFRTKVQSLSEQLLHSISETSGVPAPAAAADNAAPATPEDNKVKLVSQAMKLAWLGDQHGTKAPAMLEGYSTSVDPVSGKKAIQIDVLLTRDQLSSLAQSLQRILEAGEQSKLAPQEFFQKLQAVFAASTRDPNAMDMAHLDHIGPLLGEYLDGLPYRSELAQLTPTEWMSMSAGQQDAILINIRHRLQLYKDFEETNDGWTALPGRTAEGEKVHPVPLDKLP